MKPKKFTLRQVQYAVAVADRLGFRRAAKQCRVSQPALSSQVQRVEAALGVQLFERDRRGVRVTAGGAELLERMRQVLVAVDDLEAAARSLRDPLRGTLRIGVIPTIGPYLLPAASAAVRRELPRLTVEWTEDKTAVLLRRVRHGSLDGAFLALEAGTDDLAYEEVADDPFVLATAPDHPLGQSSGPLPAIRLRGEQILLLDEGHCLSDQVVEYCRHRGVDALGVRATSLPTLVHYGRAEPRDHSAALDRAARRNASRGSRHPRDHKARPPPDDRAVLAQDFSRWGGHAGRRRDRPPRPPRGGTAREATRSLSSWRRSRAVLGPPLSASRVALDVMGGAGTTPTIGYAGKKDATGWSALRR